MDQIDKQILNILKQDSKQNFKTIGAQIHMTGQAVGNRVRKLEEDGIIEGYTIRTKPLNQSLITAHLTLSMKTNEHYLVKTFVSHTSEVIEAARISGKGCYIFKVQVENHDRLNAICDEILKFANYSMSIETEKIK